MNETFLQIVGQLATQIDPSQGTAGAQQGAIQRLSEPTLYDLAFPFIAFGLVILLPVGVALWVMYRTVTEKTKEADEI
jgi:hypothetical protein